MNAIAAISVSNSLWIAVFHENGWSTINIEMMLSTGSTHQISVDCGEGTRPGYIHLIKNTAATHGILIDVLEDQVCVGKTTTAVHLAAMLARTSPALLIDGDPQASAASWAAWRREAGRSPSPTTTAPSAI